MLTTYLYLQEQGNKGFSKTKGAYTILCLGESTTSNRYPRFLETDLNSRNSGITFNVIDKGRPSTNSNYILASLENNLNKYKPDMVITMMGVNDSSSDVVVYEREPTESYYKQLKTYKLMKLIDLRVKSKIAEIKNTAWLKMEPKGFEKNEATAISVNTSEQEYINLANSLIEQERYKEAEGISKKAIALNPKNRQGYINLANSFREQKKYKEAIELCKKAIELDPKNEHGYIQLGDCYKQQGKYEEAESIYMKAVKICPTSEEDI